MVSVVSENDRKYPMEGTHLVLQTSFTFGHLVNLTAEKMI